jgi:hypothetical protein
MKIDSVNSGITICIPIYNPENYFFEQLEFLLSSKSSVINELVIVETASTSQTSEARLKSIFSQVTSVNLQYFIIKKNQFSHSTTRNMMAKKAINTFVAFTTQDVKYPVDFLEHLERMPTIMTARNLSGLAVRHESSISVMNESFNIQTRNFAFTGYFEGNPLAVNWWSNNFAIYNREVLLTLPFPVPVSWAEDLAWARLAVSRGHMLDIYTGTCIFHLNIDNARAAWYRGRDNERGIVELSSYLSLEIPRYGFFKDVVIPFFSFLLKEMKFAFRNKHLISSFSPIFKTLFIWSIQAFSRYFHSLRIGALNSPFKTIMRRDIK